MNEELITLPFGEQDYLALWKKTSSHSSPDKNVLLTHGTFSNKKVLNAMAEYLANQGFTCWTFEWRNHGSSSRISEDFNFETVGKKDFTLVFSYLFEQLEIKQIDCVTHSGGGICLTIALITNPQYQERINRIVMFACQAFGAANSDLKYWGIWLNKITARLLGYIPARKIGGEENESYALMRQWYNWNLSRRFLGDDGFDYQTKMNQIQPPVLSIFGKGDTIIAPPSGCQKFLDAFENPNNQALFCAKQTGYTEDYNHSRILHSRNASREIYPKVLQWLQE